MDVFCNLLGLLGWNMKHKHYEEIKKYIEDVEGQVVLVSALNGWIVNNKPAWIVNNKPAWLDCDCYLVIPSKHLEVALAFLNDGADIQAYYIHHSVPSWEDVDSDATDLSQGHILMDESIDIRIKPKTVKRWIAIRKRDHYVCEIAFETRLHASSELDDLSWSFHEIEVEE